MHDIHQGEGGEQGNQLMPLLFSLGQHPDLEAVQAQMPNEKVFAFMDDVHMATRPQRVGVGQTTLGVELFRRAGIHIHEISSNGWPGRPMEEPLCGEGLRFHHMNKASRCQVRHWGTQSLSQRISPAPSLNMKFCCAKSPVWMISRVLGCPCCIARQRRPRISHLSGQPHLPQHTIRVCGVACVGCSTWFRIKLTPSSEPQRSPLCLVGWACAVL